MVPAGSKTGGQTPGRPTAWGAEPLNTHSGLNVPQHLPSAVSYARGR